MPQLSAIDKKRIAELIRYSVAGLKQRWPQIGNYSDRAVAITFNEFYFSEDAGNNDEKFPEWFDFIAENEE